MGFASFFYTEERFLDLKGYRFDRAIFGAYILIVLFLFLAIFMSYGSDRNYHIYYSCPVGGSVCESPFYQNYKYCDQAWPGACDQQFVPAGFSFGQPMPWPVRNWGWILGSGLVLCFVINHFWHNKGRRLEVEY